MTDRKLLELAAKAAGIDLKPMQINNVREQGDDRFVGYMTDPEQWSRGWFNPLVDDGDALRLVVSLGIDLLFTPEDVEAVATRYAYEDHQEMITPWACESWTLKPQDPSDATRRAIVRTAAEIGKQMGGSND